MPWIPRQIRRLCRGTRTIFTTFLYLILLIVMFSFVATQLAMDRSKVFEKKYKKEDADPPSRFNQQKSQFERQFNKKKPMISGRDDRKFAADFVEGEIVDEDLGGPNNLDEHLKQKIWTRKKGFEQRMLNGDKQIDGQKYPMLSPTGKFIPIRRWVHIDLKGGAFKPEYFVNLFSFLKKLRINGVILEWEDMFPYRGRLANAINGYSYSIQDVEKILEAAKNEELEVVPLVQTFGHLEWILKLNEFKHLRDDFKFPTVICIGASEAWSLLTDMLSQVAEVHKRFGMKFFHIGADEAFQFGICNGTLNEMQQQGGHDRVILWHISRTAKYLRKHFAGLTVLAWHDMFGHVMEQDIFDYDMQNLVEPVLWSYAEDLKQYLPYTSWVSLKPFKRVWGSSAYKGADGPMRFSSNPIHYIRNHEAWIEQMTEFYNEFDYLQGLIITGWSRYDHLALLCELFPVGIPALAMSMETILKGEPLRGNYPVTNELLQCTPPSEIGYTYGCQFPGSRIYELINEFDGQRIQLQKYLEKDYELNGWLSEYALQHQFSSHMYIEKILPFIEMYLDPLERLEKDLRNELNEIYFPETADEFILTYMGPSLRHLRAYKKAAMGILEKTTFQKRPFVLPGLNQP